MAKAKKWDEETVLEKFRSLPPERKKEATVFIVGATRALNA